MEQDHNLIEGLDVDRTPERTPKTGHQIMVDIVQSLRSDGDELSMQQLQILLTLSSLASQSVADLATRLHIDESTVVAICPLLVARGLIIRIPGDPATDDVGRVILSSAGHRFVDNLLYREGSRAGAFSRIPVTADDLRQRNDDIVRSE